MKQKFRLKKGARRSSVVTFAAITLQGQRFKPWPGQKFKTSSHSIPIK